MSRLADRGGRLVWSADEKASWFSAHFDAKQYRYSFQQQHSCDHSSVLCFLSFGLSLFANYPDDGGNYPDDMFLLVYKQVEVGTYVGCNF